MPSLSGMSSYGSRSQQVKEDVEEEVMDEDAVDVQEDEEEDEDQASGPLLTLKSKKEKAPPEKVTVMSSGRANPFRV